MADRKLLVGLTILLVVFAVASRMVPHPANFAPIGAIALFGGAVLPRKIAVVLPLAAMIISDFFIGFHPLILYTWGSFALIAIFSSYRFRTISLSNVIVGSLVASLLFFVVSNFGVWFEGRLYDRTLVGLIECYHNALPFFRGTLQGDLVYSSILFGAYSLVLKHERTLRRSAEVVG